MHERLTIVAKSLLILGLVAVESGMAEESKATAFLVHPIGRIRKDATGTEIILDAKYKPGLLGLDGFSHVHVIWWFDRNDTPQQRATLQVHPRGNPQNPLTGVFACRSPFRPNLIAVSLCKIREVRDDRILVEDIDAFDGTPVLDLKPYTPGMDSAADARVPAWAGPRK